MGATRTLLFFSNTVPTDSSGSFIIFRRHLAPLVESGWKLKIFSYFPAPASGVFWQHVRLPLRRRWWPPASPRVLASQRLRTRLMLRDLERGGFLGHDGERILLANLWDSQAVFAAALARRNFAPFGVFAHDDEIVWNRRHLPQRYLHWRREDVTNAASRVWSVSARLKTQFARTVQTRCRILRPIPGPGPGRTLWRDAFSRGVTLGYAGKMYPGLSRVLAPLAAILQAQSGRMVVITDAASAERPAVSSPAIFWRPFLPSAHDAVAWLAGNCSALLVAHPPATEISSEQWQMLRTSFPSKLTEYAQLGLPLVLVGERDSEFGDWAADHPAIPFFSGADDPRLPAYFSGLCEPAAWRAAAEPASKLAEDEFNPLRLQNDFVTDLSALQALSPR